MPFISTSNLSFLLRFTCWCPIPRSSVILLSISRIFSIAFTSLISFSFLSLALSASFSWRPRILIPSNSFAVFVVLMIEAHGLGGSLDFCTKEIFRSVIPFLISFFSVCSDLNFLSLIGACCWILDAVSIGLSSFSKSNTVVADEECVLAELFYTQDCSFTKLWALPVEMHPTAASETVKIFLVCWNFFACWALWERVRCGL